jgi:hypothetical protein
MRVYAKDIELMTDEELNSNVWKFEVGAHDIGDDVYLSGFSFGTYREAHDLALAKFIEEYGDRISEELQSCINVHFVYILRNGERVRPDFKAITQTY